MRAITEAHWKGLAQALADLLGQPEKGAIAFLRCLPDAVLAAFSDRQTLQIPGWQVYVVGAEADGESRITADQAVDLREAKGDNVLLLVDPRRAGAGMDGIYSAAREITEQELFSDRVLRSLREQLPHGTRRFAQKAPGQARKVGGQNPVSPWEEFDFLAHCVAEPDRMGAWVALLGLWPIAQTDEGPHEGDLEIAARLSEKLLLSTGASHLVPTRVASILLPEDAQAQKKALIAFLQEHEYRPWRETARALIERPNLWLHALCPRFHTRELHRIKLKPWRASTGRLLAYSGLKESEEGGIPVLQVNPWDPNSKTRMEVRWETEPEELSPGAVEYLVSVRTGTNFEEELISRRVLHGKRSVQSCAFTAADFEDLGEGTWHAVVCVHPVGEERPAEGESPRWVQTGEFLLQVGETGSGGRAAGAGKKVRALVEEAIRFDSEEFLQLVRASVQEDKDHFLSCLLPGRDRRVGRVYCPPIIREIEEDWRGRRYVVGRWSVRVHPDGKRADRIRFHEISLPEAPGLRDRMTEANRNMGTRAQERHGFIGLIYPPSFERTPLESSAVEYVNAWLRAFETGDPQLALANTLEVQTLTGETVGLLVLPMHPLRVAWHHAYDVLAYHMRYAEEKSHRSVVDTLSFLDGSHIPAFLPGLQQGRSFVFGDMLGFYVAAMLRDDDPEPQASLARMARLLSPSRADLVGLVEQNMAEAVAEEVQKYLQTHPEYARLRINALRPGDGLTTLRALGRVLAEEDEEQAAENGSRHLQGYFLDLYPADARAVMHTGSYLTRITEQHRQGAGSVPAEDRWMLDTYTAGRLSLPRLQWARRRPDRRSGRRCAPRTSLACVRHFRLASGRHAPRRRWHRARVPGSLRPRSLLPSPVLLHSCATLDRGSSLSGRRRQAPCEPGAHRPGDASAQSASSTHRAQSGRPGRRSAGVANGSCCRKGL